MDHSKTSRIIFLKYIDQQTKEQYKERSFMFHLAVSTCQTKQKKKRISSLFYFTFIYITDDSPLYYSSMPRTIFFCLKPISIKVLKHVSNYYVEYLDILLIEFVPLLCRLVVVVVGFVLLVIMWFMLLWYTLIIVIII